MSLRRAALAVSALLALGCQSKPAGHPQRGAGAQVASPAAHTRQDAPVSAEQLEVLGALAAAADANPDDFAARKASGMAHMWATLGGGLDLRDRAEADLEAAFALDPSHRGLSRALGRFYNLRAVAGDSSKADMQVTVYAAHLGEAYDPETGEVDVDALDTSTFVAYSFFELGRILAAKNAGKLLDALRRVKALERTLAERAAAHPDDVELRALAGNFSFFFAGNIPMDRERRVADAVASFEVLRARWDELTPRAKERKHCPNTYENFMFELAEGYAVLERGDEARAIYSELAAVDEPSPIAGERPRTRARELIATVSRERLDNLDAYLGDMRLMPPWPSDAGNCVVCHAWQAEVGLGSLHAIDRDALVRDLLELPTQTELAPVFGTAPE